MMAMLVSVNLTGCGTKNLGSCPGINPLVKCTELTADEKIRIALDDGDLDTARSLLEEAIAAEPENYNRYPLLAAVYSGLAGFRLLNAISGASSTSGSTSVTSALDAFLPDPASMSRSDYNARIDLMGLAVSTIQALPASFLAESGTDKYAASAAQQLPLYLSAHAAMYMKLFTFNFDSGTSDLSQLTSMSATDADAIIAILTTAAAQGGTFGDLAASTLASINSGGGNNLDNLANFLGNSGS
ncbi:MAG: hypothetical protein RIQ81_273 [Pseudomonadota bacterium]|jgi:hypothetical protein